MELMALPNPRLSSKAMEDLDLIQSAVNGNQKSYSLLMDRYRNSIFHMMLKMVHNRAEADDLTMEAFGKAFHKLPNYVPRYAFSTWLFKIAVNNCIDHVRKKKLPVINTGDAYGNSDSDFDILKFLRSEAVTPEDEMIRRERIEMMRVLLDRLSEKYRMMIELRFYEELSYEEIAQEMNIPLGTVKAQLFRAKELLYQMLQSPYAKSYLERTTRHEKEEAIPGEAA
jgi:RNA polymerase sigma factor (sigma-70 family)